MSEALHRYLQQQQIDPGLVLKRLQQIDRPLGRWLQQQRQQQERPLLVGINGAQGTGKSTFAATLKILLLEEFGLQSAVLSLDDYYLTQQQRAERSITIHPLLKTRGVPGTHDLPLLELQLQQLRQLQPGESLQLPRFDKSQDERSGYEMWCVPPSGVDLILLEGWCVGAVAEPPAALDRPLNALERDLDPEAVWRTFVNKSLNEEYQQLFAGLDRLLMLQAPDMEAVVEWRQLQERKLRQRSGGEGMSEAEVHHFIQHFERLTRHMLLELPQTADVVLPLGRDHQIQTIRFK